MLACFNLLQLNISLVNSHNDTAVTCQLMQTLTILTHESGFKLIQVQGLAALVKNKALRGNNTNDDLKSYKTLSEIVSESGFRVESFVSGQGVAVIK